MGILWAIIGTIANIVGMVIYLPFIAAVGVSRVTKKLWLIIKGFVR